jgi:hypothetical protein
MQGLGRSQHLLPALMLAGVMGAFGVARGGANPKEWTLAWSVQGSWSGVAVDGDTGSIYATSETGKCIEVDSNGKNPRLFELPQSDAAKLRLVNLSKSSGKALLTFQGTAIRVYDLKGKHLWSYSDGDGTNDVWPSDLNGDGSDEVIIGYNGASGIHVLDSRGKSLWFDLSIGNVWHVCAGDAQGSGVMQVLATSALGQIHVFSKDGRKVKDLSPGCYANMVRLVPVPGSDKKAMILAGGSLLQEKPERVLIGLTSEGRRKWSLKLSTAQTSSIDSAVLAPSGPWLAVGMRDGLVHIIDVNKGSILGTVKGQGEIPEVTWGRDSGENAPLLLVATGGNLNAFRLADKR